METPGSIIMGATIIRVMISCKERNDSERLIWAMWLSPKGHISNMVGANIRTVRALTKWNPEY